MTSGNHPVRAWITVSSPSSLLCATWMLGKKKRIHDITVTNIWKHIAINKEHHSNQYILEAAHHSVRECYLTSSMPLFVTSA